MSKKGQKNKAPKAPKTPKAPLADSVVFKNVDLKTLIAWLDVPLHSQQAIARNRVCEQIGVVFNAFEKERLALVEKYGDRDPKTNEIIIITNPDGSTNFKLKDKKAFEAEYNPLADTDAIFDILPSNRQHWKTVREIIASSKMPMDVAITTFWEGVLKALENV